MPWSRSEASWKYVHGDAWAALQAAMSTNGPGVHVLGEASANSRLSGAVEVSAGAFTAAITVKDLGPLEEIVGVEEQAERYFDGMRVRVQSEEGDVTVSVRGPMAQEQGKRASQLLGALWDLQLFTVRMLQSRNGEGQPALVGGEP